MAFDTKTLWMTLTVSNLLFGLMMLAYAYPGLERPVIRTWAFGQILKGLGIAAILFRGALPAELAFLGNSGVILGYFLELSAFLRYSGRHRPGRPLMWLLPAAMLLVLNGSPLLMQQEWQSRHTAVIFSSCLAVLTACSALVILGANRRRSAVQIVLATSNALISAAFLSRAVLAAGSPDWAPAGNFPINQVLFAAGYVFSITDGFGFLLLVKEDADRSLLRMATIDSLTGLANRTAFMERAEDRLKLCRRTGQPAAAVMMDVDHFKAINDTFGHAAGDAVLAGLGRVLAEHLRDVDVCGRLGGEEFAFLLPGTSAEAALHVAERLRHAVADMSVFVDGRRIAVTASFGIADCGSAESLEPALSQADDRLYAAKADGRNRVAPALGFAVRRTAEVVKLVT